VSRIAQKRSSYESVPSRLGKWLAISGVCTAFVGCSGGPTPIELPQFDPGSSAAKAMELYDKDDDGFIAGAELDQAPALKAARKQLDTNEDERVSEQEIVDRIARFSEVSIGLTNVTCQVTLDGTPLDGATIRFVPDECLEGVIKEASDVTNIVGLASPSVPKEMRPSADTPPGIQIGLYKVIISKKKGDQEFVPEKFNTKTILGQQVAPDDPSMRTSKVEFNLRSK
jgi:hypothetical protein